MKKYDLSVLPSGSSPDSLEYPHFPTLHQLVIWRNIGLVPAERIAATLETSVANVVQAAVDMGLDPDESNCAVFLERGFQTIIRRNWDILPYEQILDLLQWTPEKLAYILKEDDFFWVKLGFGKPRCAPVKFRQLDEKEQKRTAEIKKVMEQYFSDEPPAAEQPFAFLNKYGRLLPADAGDPRFDMKMVYSYSALYGDPLLDPEISSYPEDMLADYAACGVNAVWMQMTLYTVVPYFGENFAGSLRWQERLENLRRLVARAKKYGIDIILYFNEPRAMPPEFFEQVPFRMGARQTGYEERALCCSDPKTLKAVEDAVCELFTRVPGLGGLFCISMSENLTHCKSRLEIDIPCPYCADIPVQDLVLDMNLAIERGMHRAAPDAKFIVYTWAWHKEWMDQVISKLPAGTRVMTVSETLLKTNCRGVEGELLDYSVSKVGPGKTALGQWKCALDHQLKPMAKVQLNNSWELSAVPYIPAVDLVERHLDNLTAAGVRDLMLCWTLGGFPGGNLELLYCRKEQLAAAKFGSAAEYVLKAWKRFSDSFELFPFHRLDGLYTHPGNYGPMSLLHRRNTFRRATMIGFPYDDIFSWRSSGHYPESVYREAYSDMCRIWKEGLDLLDEAEKIISPEYKDNLAELKNISVVCYCHFKTTLNQVDFIIRRRENLPCRDIYLDEIALALAERRAMAQDSRIGYEASNHYYFTRNDLAEKIINCTFLLGEEERI